MNKNIRTAVIDCQSVTKIFKDGDLNVKVLNDISLKIESGDMLAIVGASGSGKSSLLHVLGGLLKPTEGNVFVAGQDINKLSARKQGKLRNQALGFVYQFHHLLHEFTALENAAMPLLIQRVERSEAFARAESMLQRVGLSERLQHKPGELSGGERQRAAIARALVAEPACILADEPTGNLDHKTAASVQELLFQINEEFETSIAIVTHDLGIAQRMHRVVTIESGRLVSQ